MDKLELRNIAVEQGLDFEGAIELVFDAQQAKVEELEKQLSEYIFVSETLDEMYVKEVQKSDELQKRVDAAIKCAMFLMWFDFNGYKTAPETPQAILDAQPSKEC